MLNINLADQMYSDPIFKLGEISNKTDEEFSRNLNVQLSIPVHRNC